MEVERAGRKETLTAPTVVLAAGAILSSALLLASSNDDHPTGLANHSDQVGRNFMNHNLTGMVALNPFRRNRTTYEKTIQVNDFYLTGGPNGISGIPKPTLGGLEFNRTVKDGGFGTFHDFFGIAYNANHKVIFLYLMALVLVVATLFVINRLLRMPLGRAWEALREDEIACKSLGLNPTIIKLTAFTIGACFAGFAGSFFASRQGFISPESFVFIESAIVLAIVVLGGMGSQIGVVLAAIVMTVLPELAREFNEYRMLMFGLLMVFMMIWRPQGLLPMSRPHMELRK